MRLLADENIPGAIIGQLRARGYDVFAVAERMRGAADRDVLACASAESRIVLTFDKDFGELAVRHGLPAFSGIILFRLEGESPEMDNARTLAAIESRQDWIGHFSMVTRRHIRMRPLSRTPQ